MLPLRHRAPLPLENKLRMCEFVPKHSLKFLNIIAATLIQMSPQTFRTRPNYRVVNMVMRVLRPMKVKLCHFFLLGWSYTAGIFSVIFATKL